MMASRSFLEVDLGVVKVDKRQTLLNLFCDSLPGLEPCFPAFTSLNGSGLALVRADIAWETQEMRDEKAEVKDPPSACAQQSRPHACYLPDCSIIRARIPPWRSFESASASPSLVLA